MSANRNLLNIEYRDFCKKNKFPMSDSSTYVSDDGRRIPLSFFIDMVIYPVQDTPRAVYVSNISVQNKKLVITFSNALGQIGTVINNLTETSYIYDSHKNIIGTVAFFVDSLAYVYGLCINKELTFSNNALQVHPARVFSTTGIAQKIYLNGEEVVTDKPLTVSFDSDRFVFNTDTKAYDLNLKVTDLNRSDNLATMAKINGYSFKNNQAWIYAAKDSNIRISVKADNTLYFYRKGDTINVQ